MCVSEGMAGQHILLHSDIVIYWKMCYFRPRQLASVRNDFICTVESYLSSSRLRSVSLDSAAGNSLRDKSGRVWREYRYSG